MWKCALNICQIFDWSVLCWTLLDFVLGMRDELDECLFLLEINKKVKVNKGYNTIDKTRL